MSETFHQVGIMANDLTFSAVKSANKFLLKLVIIRRIDLIHILLGINVIQLMWNLFVSFH